MELLPSLWNHSEIDNVQMIVLNPATFVHRSQRKTMNDFVCRQSPENKVNRSFEIQAILKE